MESPSKSTGQSIAVVLLALALIVTLVMVFRLVTFHESKEQTVLYTDSPTLLADAGSFPCTRARNFKFDVRDYSHNVVKNPTGSRQYRYKTNLSAEPPVDIHILSIEGGSGRVVVEKSGKPTWLVLISARPGIWHVEQSLGATLERVITNQAVSEIRFTQTLSSGPRSVIDLLLHSEETLPQTPVVTVLPDNRCLTGFLRFQEHDKRQKFVQALAAIREGLGHPELSFQSAGSPSYFQTPFRVPFVEAAISLDRLAAVKKLAEAPRQQVGRGQGSAEYGQSPAAEFQKYANMRRRDDVKAITFATVGDFLNALGEYREQNLLPSSMPSSRPGAQSLNVAEWYEFEDYRNAYTKRLTSGESKDACSGSRDRRLLIVEGTDSVDIVKCAWGDQLYFMKSGDDHVDDSWEDDIIYAGPGDDKIDAGWGNDLLFFNYGWGQDTVEKTCSRSAYIPQDSAGSAKVNWSREWPHKNFIVFGKGVSRDDIVSVNGKIVHKLTGDSINIKGDCFNLVFWP